jgi:CRISPR-associated protein Cas1
VDNFYIFGEMNFNTALINFIAQNGVILHFFNYYGFYTGSFYPKETLNSGMLTVK